MNWLQIIILSIIQGLAELLPVSSSAHVIVAEKMMGRDPTSPESVFLLLMLHTGTMFAVILYFWSSWKKTFFASTQTFISKLPSLIIATLATGALGWLLKKAIEHFALKGEVIDGVQKNAEIESIFGNLGLVSAALAAAGVLILIAGLRERAAARDRAIGTKESLIVGLVQGLCLPFRGFSRSGATISAGMLLGIAKSKAEEFSFALAVILTPLVVAQEGLRVVKAHIKLSSVLAPSVVGMVFAFLAGLVALKWLSGWLEKGRWSWFGAYCLIAAGIVFGLYMKGL